MAMPSPAIVSLITHFIRASKLIPQSKPLSYRPSIRTTSIKLYYQTVLNMLAIAGSVLQRADLIGMSVRRIEATSPDFPVMVNETYNDEQLREQIKNVVKALGIKAWTAPTFILTQDPLIYGFNRLSDASENNTAFNFATFVDENGCYYVNPKISGSSRLMSKSIYGSAQVIRCMMTLVDMYGNKSAYYTTVKEAN